MQERPDLEELRSNIVTSSAQMRTDLKEIEDRILYKLTTSEGSPVDNIDLILTLEASKVKTGEIKVWYLNWTYYFTIFYMLEF